MLPNKISKMYQKLLLLEIFKFKKNTRFGTYLAKSGVVTDVFRFLPSVTSRTWYYNIHGIAYISSCVYSSSLNYSPIHIVKLILAAVDSGHIIIMLGCLKI